MKKLIIICLILISYFVKANTLDAKIEISTLIPLPGKITPLFFGSFIEFIKFYMNGPYGMTAQELVDRGFDMGDKERFGISYPWKPLRLNNAEGNWSLVEGGVNLRGKYHQRINRLNEEGIFGIFQHVFLSDTSANDFYIYFKGDESVRELIFTLYDSSFSIIHYTFRIGIPYTSWQKISFTVPYLPGITQAMLTLTINGIGSVYLDESSFMPQNNVYGIRAEHYNYFKNLKPGILRYPGGFFADIPAAHWEYGIGDIDQRQSPNLCFEGISQRLDFGTDEFISFCRLIGAEPHLTVNFVDGTPEEAASWVEYCNGSIETKYGAMRTANGHPEPYNVKYWEVGNEQYDDSINMANRYLLYYDAMKSVDSSIITMIDGNIWEGFNYFNSVMEIAGNKVDLYGWHHVNGSIQSDDTTYHLLFLIGSIEYGENSLKNIFQWLCDSSYYPKTKQAVTEWWSGHSQGWVNDVRSWAMETAIADALTLHIYMRNPESFVLAERTTFVESGILISRFDSLTQKRQIFGGAPYYASMLMRNHSGIISFPVDISCPTYDIPEEKIPWSPKNVKWLDAVATATEDTLFLSVVNRHSSDTVNTLILCNVINQGLNTKVYTLSSPNYLDMNTPSEPFKVIPNEGDFVFNTLYQFPPNSLTILAFPVKGLVGIADNNVDNYSYFSINPNPFNDKINIYFKNNRSDDVSVYLFDLLGNIVYENNINIKNNMVSINTEYLSSGTYIVRLESRGVSYSKLLFKIK
ncbi:MAG: T9SS type A sorting domain-containing protein [Bacteroidetes bacterium]|nr:T9SS type A sorting domain-containing protein [Bacteroidota bacterium]